MILTNLVIPATRSDEPHVALCRLQANNLGKKKVMSYVTEHAFAQSADAVSHFASLLGFETDCWDVHASVAAGDLDFVLLDVRSAAAYEAGHAAGALSMPRATISPEALREYPNGTRFVVYCNGPHCNGADKAARALAQLGRPVKKMIGGVEGWKDEGFDLVTD